MSANREIRNKGISWAVVFTNVLYIIAGLAGNWLTIVGGATLALGSGWMHYEQEFKSVRSWHSIMADWLGMYAFSLTVLAYLTTPWVLLLLIPILLLGNEIRDPKLVGMLVILTCLIEVNFIALLLFAIAYGIREWGHGGELEDLTHAGWHLFTSVGYWWLLGGFEITLL